MTLPRDRHACPSKNSALCTGGGARFFDGYSRWRMGRSPGDRLHRTRRYLDHVCDRVPLAEKLADLLLADIEHQHGLVIVFGGVGVDVMQVQPAARGCVQDAHECALCVAVTDGESVHVVPKIDCRNENLQSEICKILTALALLPATSPITPRRLGPWGKHWPRGHSRTPATPDPGNQ